MTVAAINAETVYALAGTALGPFSTVWPYAAPSDVTCKVDYGDGNGPQLLVQGTDYFLTANNPTLSNGGSVMLAAYILSNWGVAWGPGAEVILARLTPRSQPSSFGEAVGFSPQASEQALDNVERQVQELTAQMSRCLQVGYGETPFPPIGGSIPSSLWGVNAAGEFFSFGYGTQPGKLLGTDVTGALSFYNLPAGVTPPPGLITASGSQFQPWAIHPVRTSLGSFSGTLPPRAGLLPGTPIWVLDADYNAGANHFTVNASPGDLISSHGAAAPSWLLQISNQIAMFINSAASWTVIGYGS